MAHLKDLLVAGSSRFIGEVAFNNNVTFNDSVTLKETLILAKNPQDAEGTSEAYPALIIGDNGNAGVHLAIDGNEIMAKSDIDSPSVLYINNNGGDISFGGNVTPKVSGTLDLGTSSVKWRTLYIGDGSGSSSSSTGNIQVNGGIGTSGASYIGGALISNGAFTANSTALIKGAITGNSTLTVSNTGQVGNAFTIKNASGGDASLIFDRASNANWKIMDSSGDLYFQSDYTSNKGSYYNVLRLDYNTKRAAFYGDVIPNGNATQNLGGSSNKWEALYVGDGTDATSTSTGVILASGGIAATKAGYFGGDVTADQLHITNTNGVGHITFARESYNYIHAKTAGGVIAFVVNGQTVGSSTSEMVIQDGVINPGTTAVTDLGSTSLRWKGIYSGIGNFSGNLIVSGTAAITRDTTIGDGTSSTSMDTGALKVAGGIGATGQVNAKTVRVDNSVYFQYNSTDKCLDVIFG